MSKVVVTGADGFTGRYLCPLLSEAGHEVHGVMNRPGTEVSPGVHTQHRCDLLDFDSLSPLVSAIRPTLVVHLAAIAFVGHGDVDAIYRTNIVGTRNLLEALSRCGGDLEAILLASSANIYGNSTARLIDESVAPAPANDYAVSKLSMEYVARIYANRLPIVMVRPFNYTGVGQSLDFIIPKIVDHMRRRVSTIELGNLDVARDFSDVRGVAETYARLLKTPAARGDVFNVCSGRTHTLQDVLDIARDISGHRLEVKVNPAFVRSNEVKTLCGDRAKLDAVIGQFPTPTFSETLRWMLEA